MLQLVRHKSLLKLAIVVFVFAAAIPNSHGQYYFGRNKIQYDDFQWKILKTQHFDVYFYPEMQELAEIGAAFAEQAYRRLEAKLNHNIVRRIPLIFYSNHSHFQQTNTIPNFIPEGVGGFFEFIKGRVVIPANGSIPKFKQVINHELVHVFTRSKMSRVLKDHRKTKFGGMPLWFTEGIAEYWSTGWDSQAEMIIRDAVLSGHLVPLSQMNAIYGTFLMYKEGQAICRYIAQTFGEEKLLQLIENIWKESRFSDVMKLTIGLNYQEFDKKWLYDLKKEKYPLLEHGDSPKMTSESITKEGLNTKPACFFSDGKGSLVFSSNRVGYSNIYVKSLDSNEVAQVLVKGGRTSDFESFHLLSSKLDVNQRGELAFVSKSGARDVLYIMDIATKQKIKQFDFGELVSLFSPNWSPDDKKIVLTGITFSGRSDLFIVDVADGRLERLTNDFYDDRDPAWSPDGRTIAFSSDRGYHGGEGYMNLFVYDIAHQTIRYLTSGRNNDYSPAWSPDGQWLAFSSDRDASFNVWVMKNPTWHQQIAELETMDQRFDASRERVALDDSSGQVRPRSGHTSKNGHDNGRQFDNSDKRNGSNSYSEPWRTIRFVESSAVIRTSDELKKITNYVTGALDPTWLDDDTILFTAFENFSFQIQKIDRVGDRFEEAALAKSDSIHHDRDHWTAEKLIGSVESTTLKYRRRFSLDIAQS
ncbi:hypothetical protein MJD09_01890, partial [bacterium]|nr:hypothetical protein [bacterium]